MSISILKSRIEELEGQLAVCGIAARCNDRESRKLFGHVKGDSFWTESYQDVVDAVGREIIVRERYNEILSAISDHIPKTGVRPGETLHKAALNYIMEAETRTEVLKRPCPSRLQGKADHTVDLKRLDMTCENLRRNLSEFDNRDQFYNLSNAITTIIDVLKTILEKE